MNAQAPKFLRELGRKGVCVCKLLSGSHRNSKSTFLGLFGQAGSQVGHGLAPNRKCTIGFSALAQPKMGRKENGMFLLIRKPQSGGEGSGGASGHTPHKCGRLMGETRPKGLEQGSWGGGTEAA